MLNLALQPAVRDLAVAAAAALAIGAHLVMRYALAMPIATANWPLLIVLAGGGAVLIWEILRNVLAGRFGADMLAAVAIVTALIQEQYVAGVLVVLMLSGGTALEQYATGRASSVLDAVARRMPQIAHRRRDGEVADIPVAEVRVGDTLSVFPHEICPVDGLVLEGRGSMDEAYLTGEPYQISKSPGSTVLSGAQNGENVLTIQATKPAGESRYAQIMQVVRDTESNQPQLRRLGDRLGAWYTPVALAIAGASWALSGESSRFLSVIVIATPCPLLIAIPVAVIGAISLAARRGILIRNASALEDIQTCVNFVFDKTGTLTYGKPEVTEVLPAAGFERDELLRMAASLERYSRHPLAAPLLVAAAAASLPMETAEEVHEKPGQGLTGKVGGKSISIMGRKQAVALRLEMPPEEPGLECIILAEDKYAGLVRFRDTPRKDTPVFVEHLKHAHRGERVVLLSGDRESEVQYLAKLAGIDEVLAGQSPEQKVQFVQKLSASAPTLYVGDGINDAPALLAATVGLALGDKGDIAAQAADAVILDPSLRRVDQFIHIGERMRSIALQSAIGGMALSVMGMGLACAGLLPPTSGAIFQEVIDVLAVLNALRVSFTEEGLTDY